MNIKLLTIEEVANFYKKPKSVIYNWLQNNVLPRELTVKTGRTVYFVESKLEKFILEGTVT